MVSSDTLSESASGLFVADEMPDDNRRFLVYFCLIG